MFACKTFVEFTLSGVTITVRRCGYWGWTHLGRGVAFGRDCRLTVDGHPVEPWEFSQLAGPGVLPGSRPGPSELFEVHWRGGQMSRTPGEEKSRSARRRLRLFEAGNVLCPICLEAEFTEEEARRGETATLEDVPPKSFNAGGFPMCLTCAACNNKASKAEQVTADNLRLRSETKVAITTPALLDGKGRPRVHTGYAQEIDGKLVMRMSRLQVSERDFTHAVKPEGRRIELSWRVPTAHGVGVPWLKAAYLTVFSLLGPVCGYRYAKSEALESVREQIRSPGEKIIHGFSMKLDESGGPRPQFVVVACPDPPCWAVLMGDCIVRLPTLWDRSFYDRVGSERCDFNGVPHRPVRFGSVRPWLMPPPDGAERRKDAIGAKRALPLGGVDVPCTLVDFADHEGPKDVLLVNQAVLELVSDSTR